MSSDWAAPALLVRHASAVGAIAKRAWSRSVNTSGPPPFPCPSAPDQPQAFGNDIAQRQQHAGPDERRDEVRDLKPPERHLEDAGDQRHGRAQGPEKPSDENPGRAPFADERLAFRDQGRMARGRPDMLPRAFELAADPVRQPVAERRADRPRDPDRPEIQLPRADHRSEQNQRAPGVNQQLNEDKRLHEREHEHDRRRPGFVLAREIDDRLNIFFKHMGALGGSLRTNRLGKRCTAISRRSPELSYSLVARLTASLTSMMRRAASSPFATSDIWTVPKPRSSTEICPSYSIVI